MQNQEACMTNGVSSTSTSFSSSRWRYDVFLSFRGLDTRNTFTAHLYKALCSKGVNTFRDNDLERGEEITPTLLRTIEDSMTSIIVFSKNYASSEYCLDELVKILQCKESNKQIVWPIFYQVEPAIVRHHRDSFGEALVKHACNYKVEQVESWRRALTQAADLSGWPCINEQEANFIDKIAEKISIQVSNSTYLNVAKYPVGLESRVQDMDKLLCIGEEDVRMVWIWGTTCGIGKTTLAKAVYNSIKHQFRHTSFLANVKEKSMPHGVGLVQLQETLLFDILGDEKLKVGCLDKGVVLIKKRLQTKKVLVILDDVDHMDQLENLVGGAGSDWFGLGSKVIITTRATDLLNYCGVKFKYEVKELNDLEATKLFSLHAFKRESPKDDYVDLVRSFVTHAKGIPLTLKTLGSSLCGKSIDEWQDKLDSFERVPNKQITDIFKLSYNGLKDPQKEIFLNIACFLNGEDRGYIISILESWDFGMHSIQVLINKSLVTVGKNNELWVHDLLEDMSKEIVRQESLEPDYHNRLWFNEDVCQKTGRRKIRDMNNFPKDDEIHLSPKVFSKMKSVRHFINRNASLVGDIEYLPKLLSQKNIFQNLQSLPSNYHPNKFVADKMPSSNIVQLIEQPNTDLVMLESLPENDQGNMAAKVNDGPVHMAPVIEKSKNKMYAALLQFGEKLFSCFTT